MLYGHSETAMDKVQEVPKLIKDDIEQVQAELRQRRQCRHVVFVAVMGAMVTSGFALIALMQHGKEEQWQRWALLGSFIPLFTLSVGILVSINKVRAVNVRSGYISALHDYIIKDKKVSNYGGWQLAIRATKFCSNVRASSYGPGPPCGCPPDNDCIAYARSASQVYNKSMSTWSRDTLKSFTVLTAAVYSVMYILISASFIVVALMIIRLEDKQIRWQWLVGIASFLGCMLLAACSGIFYKKKGIRNMLLFVCRAFLLGGGLGIIIVGGHKIILPEQTSTALIAVFGVGGGILFVTGLAILLYDQVYKIHKGDYSSEIYYHLWLVRFERCPLMKGGAIYGKGQEVTAGTYKCLTCDCNESQKLEKYGELVRCKCGSKLFYKESHDDTKNTIHPQVTTSEN